MKQCPLLSFGADDGNRTRVSSLGSWRSTIELHLRSVIIIHLHFLFVKHCQKFFSLNNSQPQRYPNFYRHGCPFQTQTVFPVIPAQADHPNRSPRNFNSLSLSYQISLQQTPRQLSPVRRNKLHQSARLYNRMQHGTHLPSYPHPPTLLRSGGC